ncbi:MAG: hypothetical protein Q8N18_05540 [Opitutaceae bacterium]|nr:hypothetical protein [Opitutaceae bacterium]
MRTPTRLLGFVVGLGLVPGLSAQISTPPRLGAVLGGGAVDLGQRIVLSPQYGNTAVTTLVIQWRKDGSDLPGQTASTLVIDEATARDTGSYSVVAANDAGASAASVTVTVRQPAAPFVTIQPRSQSALVGQAVTLNFAATGSFPRTHQWRKDGTDIPGATAATFTRSGLSLADAGSYTVVVGNAFGSTTTSPAALTISSASPPTLVGFFPDDMAFSESQPAVLPIRFFGGSPPFTFQWFKNGTPVPGATDFQIVFSAITPADAGRYSVVVSNVAGSATSRTAVVTIVPPSPIAFSSVPRSASLPEGQGFSLHVAATGSPPIALQWRKDGVAISGATSSALTVFAATLDNAGIYTVLATNPAGAVISPAAIVSVEPAPLPRPDLLDNVSISLGATRSLNVLGFSTTPSTYQWHKDGVAILGATDSSYTIGPATRESAGTYFAVVTNSAGSTTSQASEVSVTAAAQNTAWLSAERAGDVVYFAFANPARIERFDLGADAWLPPIALSQAPTAFTVANNSLYVALGRSVFRHSADGSRDGTPLANFGADIIGLSSWNGFLLVAEKGDRLSSVRLIDGARVATVSSTYQWSGSMAVVQSTGQIFSRTSGGITPADITMATIQAGGQLSPIADSRYHGDYRIGGRSIVFPNELHFADDSGVVYRTSDMTFGGSIGLPFDDLAFSPSGNPIVLRAGLLHAYDANFNETGRLAADISAVRLFVKGNDAFVFGHPSTNAIGTIPKTRLAISAIQARAAGAIVDPTGLGFAPDAVFLDRDAVVLLYSKVHRNIFRWSTAQRRYLDSIPLQGWPNFVTYSPTQHRLYFGYSDSRVTQIKLDAGKITEEPFCTAPERIVGLAAVGEFVLLCDRRLRSFYLFSQDGRMISHQRSGQFSYDYVWNSATRRIYHFRDNLYPNDLLYTEVDTAGVAGVPKDSPYHGELVTRYPIRVSPNGDAVLIGSGKIFDGTSLVEKNSLANSIDEATWSGARIYTGRAVPSGIEFQRWDGSIYTLERTASLPGRLMRLFEIPDHRLLAVTSHQGLVYFNVLSQDLEIISTDFGGAPKRLANLSARAVVGRGDQIMIPGFVISGNESKTVLVRVAGPALTGFGVGGALADPSFTIYRSSTIVAANDNWSVATNLSAANKAATQVGAFSFLPGSRDSAALLTLSPGAYTVQVRGVGDTSGVALVKVYDTQVNIGSSRLMNIATRAFVGTGGDLLIAGMVVHGSASKTVLIRAIGPALTPFGVGGALTNPRLRIFRGNDLIGENDDWGGGGAATASRISDTAASVGAFPLGAGSRDAAVLLTLTPGAYSVQVSGVNDETGVALVEVYETPE